jgi:hypothetical protein
MAAIDPSTEEESPLLSNGGRPISSGTHSSTRIHQTHSPKVIILLLFCIIFVLAFGGGLMGIPAVRLYEDIVCHHYYEKLEGPGRIGLLEDIDESLCKGDEVQNQMNQIFAGLQVLGVIPGIYSKLEDPGCWAYAVCVRRFSDDYSIWVVG